MNAFPFTVLKVYLVHPEYNNLYLYGSPRIITNKVQTLAEANSYIFELSSTKGYPFDKYVEVVLILIDETKLRFKIQADRNVLSVFQSMTVQYYALHAIFQQMKIFAISKVIPFSNAVIMDYLTHLDKMHREKLQN